MHRSPRVNLSGLFLVGSLFVCGCGGSSRAPVSGKVTVEGKPPGVTGIIISFVGKDNQTVTAEVGADGSYQASGVLVGENKVALNYNSPASQELQPPPEGANLERIQEYKRKVEEERTKASKEAATTPVPERYRDPSTSRLKFVVEKSNNTYNADLKR